MSLQWYVDTYERSNKFFWTTSKRNSNSNRQKQKTSNTRLFYKQRIFSTQPQFCLTFHELNFKCCLAIANTYSNHYGETHFVFSIFMSMSRPRSILMPYLCDPFFIPTLIFIVINHITSFKQSSLLFVHLLKCLLLFFDDNLDEESE